MGILDSKPIIVAAPGKDDSNFFTGFGQSTLSSIPELFGVRPSLQVEQYRAEHPWGGIGSQLLGTSIPYAGWAKATRSAKGFNSFVEGIGDMERAPITTSAMREVTRFAPFEAGRVAIASGINGQPLGEELGTSAFNLGAAGVLSGVFGAFRAAGPSSAAARIKDILPDIEADAPMQIQMRQLASGLAEGRVAPKLQIEASNRLARWAREARAEEPGPTRRYLARLAGEEADRPLSRQLERSFFRPDDYATFRSSGKKTLVRKFTDGRHGFKDESSWRAAAGYYGLPEDFTQLGQYFRTVRVDSDKAAKQLAAQAKKLTKVGDWYIGKEDEGLYVMLKRAGTDETPRARDTWLAFKTDSPERFVPEATWAKKIEAHESWLPVADIESGKGGAAFQFGKNLQRELPEQNYVAAQKTGKVEGMLRKFTGTTGQRFVDTATYLLTPAINQAARSPKANYILKAAQFMFDNAEQRATEVLLGERALGNVKGVLSVALGKSERALEGGIAGRIKNFTDEEVEQFVKLWRQGAGPDDLTAAYADGKISMGVKDSYGEFESAVTEFVKSRNATAKLLDGRQVQELVGHGGLSRKWEGSIKIALVDDSGELTAIADGFNLRGAQKRAEFIKGKLADEGKIVHVGDTWDSTQGQRIPKQLSVLESNPGFVESRAGVRGYRWDFDELPSKDDLIAAYGEALKDRAKSEANLAWHALFDADHAMLASQDPTMFKIVTERLNAMSGGVDDVTKVLNGWIDPLLGPTLGTNSASKIVSATNEAFWHLQLGAGNIAYPVVNMLGTIQTVLPELAFVMSAVPERAAAYYTTQLVKGNGRGRSVMSVLDPLKLMGKGMKQVMKPSAEFQAMLSRAVNDGTVDPKWIEDMVGQNSRQVGRFKEVLAGKEGFGNYVRAVSEFLPGVSERASRGYTFAVGYETGKNILGLTDDSLFKFAKQFTDRTMYRYAMADRPAVLTNPVGRLLGSMKNWMFHYLSNTLVYSDEALRGNIAPLAWQMATTGLIGGASAVPFLPSIANGFLSQTEDKDLLNWSYKALGEQGGDALYFGLPAVMGLSLSSATASPIRDANMLFSMAQWSRLQAMAGGIGDSIDYWRATGQHPGQDPRVIGQFTRAFAPKTLYRYAQVYDSPGVKSLSTGYPIVDQLNPWNKALFVAGFQPTDIERGYSTFEELLGDEEKEKKLVTALGVAMRTAMDQGDDAGVDSVFQRAQVSGLDVSRVMRSATARGKASDEDLLERNFTDQQRGAYERVMQTWEGEN